MTPEITYVVMGEDGTVHPLTINTPPTAEHILGIRRAAQKQGRGVYIAKITGSPRTGGTVEQHGEAINDPKVAFADAKERYLQRQGLTRNNRNNTIFSNING